MRFTLALGFSREMGQCFRNALNPFAGFLARITNHLCIMHFGDGILMERMHLGGQATQEGFLLFSSGLTSDERR